VFCPHQWDDLFDTARRAGTDSELSEQLLLPFFKTMHLLERYGLLELEPSTLICSIPKDDCESEAALSVTRWRASGSVLKLSIMRTGRSSPRLKWSSCVTGNFAKTVGRPSMTLISILNMSWSTHVERPYLYASLATLQRYRIYPGCTHEIPGAIILLSCCGLTYYLSSTTVFYCSFCADYILVGVSCPAEKTANYAIQESTPSIRSRSFGYNGVSSTVNSSDLLNPRHTWFCILGLHDPALEADERLSSCLNEATTDVSKARDIKDEHMLDYFKAFGQGKQPCPASSAGGASSPPYSSSELYNSIELENHLVHVHKIYLSQRKSATASK
jgi:hypothetical protein